MKLRSWLICLYFIFFIAQTPADAQQISAKDISARINAIRERLKSFSQQLHEKRDSEKKETEQAEPITPDKLSEELENRKDAKVTVLFHDSGNLETTKVEFVTSQTEEPKNMKTGSKSSSKKSKNRKSKKIHLAKIDR